MIYRRWIMKNINNRQKAVLKFLTDFIAENGISPSIREIGEAVGLTSTSSVQFNLDALEAAGYIQRDPNHKRSIHVIGWKGASRQVPVMGTIAAGMPILAIEDVEEYVPFMGNVSSDKEIFALRVKGDSMIKAGIFNGDVIFIEKTPYAENGDIVVALLGDEVTLKTFYKENGVYRLQPENDAYEPIISDTVDILGKIVRLTRDYSYRI